MKNYILKLFLAVSIIMASTVSSWAQFLHKIQEYKTYGNSWITRFDNTTKTILNVCEATVIYNKDQGSAIIAIRDFTPATSLFFAEKRGFVQAVKVTNLTTHQNNQGELILTLKVNNSGKIIIREGLLNGKRQINQISYDIGNWYYISCENK
jgi:hypothetical protein